MNTKKLYMLALGAGSLLLIGVRIFLLQGMLSGPDQESVQNDVHQAADQSGPTTGTTSTGTGTVTTGGNTTSTGVATTGQEGENTPTTYTTISLIFPPIVDEDAIDKSMELIEQNYNVTAKWRVLDSMNTYKQALSVGLQRETGVDIVLVPTDRSASFSERGYKIPFEESISPLFHAKFRPRVDHNQYTYLPVFVDPAISLTHTEQFDSNPIIDLSTIQSRLATPRETQTTHVPMMFGLNDEDADYLATNNELPFTHQETVFELLLGQALYTKQANRLRFFIDTDYWNSTTVQDTATQLGEPCSQMPMLCFVAHAYTDIYFGRLSDWFLVEQTFDNSSVEAYQLSNFPVDSTYYPLRGRGLVIRKDSPDMRSSLQWIKGYLNLQLERELPLWNHDILAADNETRQQQLIESRYKFIRSHTRNGYFVYGALDSFQQFFEQAPLVELIKGDYNINIFLRNFADQ